MLLPRIIACLDCRAGRVVKGVRFQGLRDAVERYGGSWAADRLWQGDPQRMAAWAAARGTSVWTQDEQKK